MTATTDIFVHRVLTRVRDLLKREPRFTTMTRDDLDIFLGDFERDLRRDLGDLIDDRLE
jgi:hypothetical protein